MVTPDAIADQIAAALRTIRGAWDHMCPELRSAANESRVRSTRDAAPPIPIPVLSLRRETDECLTSWVRLVTEERDLRTPLTASDVVSIAGVLMVHADWLGHHVAGRDAAAELGRYASLCRDVAINRRVRRIPLGGCIGEVTDDNGQRLRCSGNLVAWLKTDDDLLPGFITCDAHPSEHTWSAGQWQMLGHRVSRLNPDAVAALLHKIGA